MKIKKLILGLLLGLFVAENCYSFETGTWEIIKNPEDLVGSISITQKGTFYAVDLGIEYLLSRGSYGFCLFDDMGVGKEAADRELDVYLGNKVDPEVPLSNKKIFNIRKNGKSLIVTPIFHKGFKLPECGKMYIQSGDFDADNKEIKPMIQNLKWKKVK